jgi:mannose-6-phosphate isomerase-like protein (cupin superfamily)
VKYCLTASSVRAEQVPGDTVEVSHLFADAQGCEKFAQRLLRFAPGRSNDRAAEADEVLYVLDGEGTATIAGNAFAASTGAALFVGAGTSWSIETEGGLRIVSVLVKDPEPLAAGTHAVVNLAHEDRRSATAARQFALGVTPAVGCASVTQFIGYVPPGRAPDHFHRYDEVIYVLEGDGILHIDGEEALLEAGSCVHLPARLVHSLENTGATELQLLGVFRPAGSPAEAYYPDGTPAAYPAEES